MSALKVLLTGGAGMLGQYLNIELSSKYKLLSLYHNNNGNAIQFNSARADITEVSVLTDLFNSFQPDVVVHTASVSNNELASSMTEQKVFDINVIATENIASLCENHKAKLIYTSTDLVYDGSKGAMLKETAELKPVSLYAETKLEGEKRIKEVFDNYIILRVALLYGIGLNHSVCHFQKMYQNLKEGKQVRLFYDQFRTPLSLKEAAGALSKLIEIEIKGEIVNFGGRERLSRYDLGEILCRKAGFSSELLIRTSMYDIESLPKCADVSMNTDKLQSLGIITKSADESIDALF